MFSARYMLEDPAKCVATMKITMTVEEWEKLRDQLDQARHQYYPGNRLCSAITTLLTDARRVIYAPEKDALA